MIAASCFAKAWRMRQNPAYRFTDFYTAEAVTHQSRHTAGLSFFKKNFHLKFGVSFPAYVNSNYKYLSSKIFL